MSTRTMGSKSSRGSGTKNKSTKKTTKISNSMDPIEDWMVARIQNKILILILSLLEMREVKGTNTMVRRIMRNLPFQILERHLTKVYRRLTEIYKDQYLMESLDHMKVDPRTLDHNQKHPPKYFETIVQNG